MKLNVKALKEVEIGIPVIADSVYYAIITKAELMENNAKTGQNLKLQFKVADPFVATHEGKEVQNRGQVVLSRYISLVSTDKYDPDQQLKELAVAIGVPEGEDLNLEDLQGKKLKIKVKYKPAEGAYRESNDIQRFMPLGASDNFPE